MDLDQQKKQKIYGSNTWRSDRNSPFFTARIWFKASICDPCQRLKIRSRWPSTSVSHSVQVLAVSSTAALSVALSVAVWSCATKPFWILLCPLYLPPNGPRMTWWNRSWSVRSLMTGSKSLPKNWNIQCMVIFQHPKTSQNPPKKLPTKILLSWDWKDESSEVFWGGDFLFILAMACILVVTRSSETETVARLPSTSSSEASTYGKSLETWTTNQTFDVIPIFFNVTLYLSIYLSIYLYIYIYLSIYLSIYIYIYIYIYSNMCMYVNIYLYIHITCAPCL